MDSGGIKVYITICHNLLNGEMLRGSFTWGKGQFKPWHIVLKHLNFASDIAMGCTDSVMDSTLVD